MLLVKPWLIERPAQCREKQRNLKLEQYTRKENIRLLFVKEEDEKNTEEVFMKCLTEMGVYNPEMKFHAVHRVGRPRGKTRGGSHGSKPDNLRHIIARFISRKDRDLVWSQRDEIKRQNILVMLSLSQI